MLIGRSLGPGRFRLAQERVQDWYGISASSFQKGVQTLVRADLLTRTHVEEEAPLLPQGYTRVNLYELQGPFARKPPKRRSSPPKRRKKVS